MCSLIRSPFSPFQQQEEEEEAGLARSLMETLRRLKKAMWPDHEGVLEAPLISISARRCQDKSPGQHAGVGWGGRNQQDCRTGKELQGRC